MYFNAVTKPKKVSAITFTKTSTDDETVAEIIFDTGEMQLVSNVNWSMTSHNTADVSPTDCILTLAQNGAPRGFVGVVISTTSPVTINGSIITTYADAKTALMV